MPIKHHILPHPIHKKRATLLQSKAVLLYSLTLLTFFSFFKEIPSVMPGVLSYASNISVSDLLKYTNSKRASAGVGSLTINTKLTAAAQKKAEYMFKHNYWAHVAPDGTDPWSFIVAQDYDYLYAGENLAKNFNGSKEVVEAWYKSPSHRENLISDKYTDVGFASVNGILDGYETTLVVQMFGKTRGAPAEIAVKGTDKNAVTRPAVEEVPVNKPAAFPTVSTTPSIRTINVHSTAKIFLVSFASCIFILFSLDMWYSKKHAILKFTGHSFAHMLFLIFAISAVYFSLGPGRII
jgi:uncharacterized protein YkwD